ncbi:hypothetical protein MLD38_003883 [Melastoma candidum]|uniref:Uncharacterized protein n=1 Tax=Melastoma candidum TaxID=119954 RepID=A0ACB9S4N8_9MYRT|nr:hypothetical protein MLD38_003883 [Melastoma candidum]
MEDVWDPPRVLVWSSRDVSRVRLLWHLRGTSLISPVKGSGMVALRTGLNPSSHPTGARGTLEPCEGGDAEERQRSGNEDLEGLHQRMESEAAPGALSPKSDLWETKSSRSLIPLALFRFSESTTAAREVPGAELGL